MCDDSPPLSQRGIGPCVIASAPRIFNNPQTRGSGRRKSSLNVDELWACLDSTASCWVYNGRASSGPLQASGAATGGRSCATVEPLDAWDHHAGVVGGADEPAARGRGGAGHSGSPGWLGGG